MQNMKGRVKRSTLYPDKHLQQLQIDLVFSIGCVQAHSEFCIL